MSLSSPQLPATSPPKSAHYHPVSTAAATYPFQPIYDTAHQSFDPSRFSPTISPTHNPAAVQYPPAHLPLDASPATIQRFHSVSPSNLRASLAPRPSLPHLLPQHLQSDVGLSLDGTAPLSRSVSVDTAAPPQPSAQLVQRLQQQNSAIREAWAAERTYLEANRRRVEEVYQEERAIMEDIRDTWQSEKDDMQREMQALRERIQRLEGENAALRAIASPRGSPSFLPGRAPRDGSSDGSLNSRARSQNPPASGSRQILADLSSLPPGLEGASRRPHFASPGNPSHLSPTHVGSPPFAPIDPRTQPQVSSQQDFLASHDGSSDSPIPVIDVHEIDPKLEGIPIKATAVQKSTFSEVSNASSSVASPPAASSDQHQESAGEQNSLLVSKAQTLQALAAGEFRRRTLHAGHTPNHSISAFPTMTATDSTSANSGTGQSEAATPKAAKTEPLDSEHDSDSANELRHQTSYTDAPPGEGVFAADEQDPIFEPEDDKPLKGPLMVKNIPAQDEIFWAQVNKKLEPISHGEDALPTVIKSQLDQADSDMQSSASKSVAVGGDGAADDDLDDSSFSPSAQASKLEADVPLKLRTTTNFGAPFGSS
ncbi:hypothetical protein VHEMI07116 [[Torrubiella] hemipterigena]|uniref:Uncharacterized protein n=1 Tax=[Torrubiella] hemipterigena TaxID=1531966 RepID=A0A0A1TKQ3_9HYPO|nr:hypothetical protein VHEMI07116 [[Torrubiella] hemipterigena]